MTKFLLEAHFVSSGSYTVCAILETPCKFKSLSPPIVPVLDSDGHVWSHEVVFLLYWLPLRGYYLLSFALDHTLWFLAFICP